MKPIFLLLFICGSALVTGAPIAETPGHLPSPFEAYDINGWWVQPGANIVYKIKLQSDGLQITEYDYVDGNKLPDRRFFYSRDGRNENLYRRSSGSTIRASGKRGLHFSNKSGSIKYDYEKISSNTQYGNTVRYNQLSAFNRNTQQRLTHLRAGTKIPLGVSTRYSTTAVNLGNHIQSFARVNDDLFAVTFTQHHGVPDATIKANSKAYRDLIIVAGNGVYRENKVPARNKTGVNGLASSGTVMVAGWTEDVRMYRVDFETGEIKLFDTGLASAVEQQGLKECWWVGLVKYQGDYYFAVTGGRQKSAVHLFRYDGYLTRNKKEWTYLGEQTMDLPKKRGLETKLGGFSLIASEQGLHLAYSCMIYADTDNEFTVFQDLQPANSLRTNNLFRGAPYSSGILPQQPRSAFFRYAGNVYVNEKGQLEVYAVSNLLLEGNDGRLEVLKRVPR